MYSSQEWWSSGAAGGDGGDPGDPIGQSLRFRGGQRLDSQLFGSANTFGNNWTISFWVKFAGPINTTRQIIATGTRTAGGNYAILNINDGVQGQIQASGSTTFTLNGRFRDPSAWYHFVMSNDQIYINGEAQGAPAGYWSNFDGCDKFGFSNWGGTPNSKAQMYLADAYLVQQTLLPTVFGRYNEDDVWVPTEPNFAMGQSRYSDFLYTAPDSGQTYGTLGKNFHASFPASGAFDGELTQNAGVGMAGTAAGGVWLVYKPPTPIEVTKVEVWTRNYQVGGSGGGKYSVNSGNSQPLPTFSADFEWFDIGLSGTLTSFGVQDNTNSVTYIGGIRITTTEGSEILLDPFLFSADLTTSSGSFQGTRPANLAFNGSTADFAQGDPGGVGETMTYAPSTDIEFQTLEVFVPTPNATISFNGGAAVPSNSGRIQVATNGTLSATQTLVITSTNVSTAPNLAAVYINGQPLTDGVNNSYGANGFHLDFSDPNDIGADRSGNGNDFTPTGFNTTPVGIFSDMLFSDAVHSDDPADIDFNSTAQNWSSNSPPTGFNGSTSNFVQTNGTWIFRPNPPIENATLVEVYQTNGSPNQQLFFNSTNVGGTYTGQVWTEVYNGTATTINNIAGNYINPDGGNGFAGIRVNGQILVDNTGEDYDLMLDSPTQNWATYSPLVIPPTGSSGRSTTANFPNANLGFQANTVVGTANYNIWTTEATLGKVSSGQWYFECTKSTPNGQHAITPNNSWIVGWATSAIPTTHPPNAGEGDVWGVVESYAIFEGFNGLKKDTTFVRQTPASPPAESWTQVLGYAFDFDSTTDNVRLFVDGVLVNTISFDPQGMEFIPVIFGAYDYVLNINFGQKPFIHTPPAGFSALQTQNLPEAPIANGREHFQAITTGSGSGTSYAQGEINISDPFVADPAEEKAWRDGSLVNYVGVVTLDAGQVFNPLYVWSAAANTGLQIFISEDGQTWTDTGETRQNGPGASFYFNGPARYIRFGNGGGTWQADYFQGVGTLDILGAAQTTFPNGLWWIKDRVNANQNQLVDNVMFPGVNSAITCPNSLAVTSGNYTAPAGNSVAWCWDASDPATSGFNIIKNTNGGAGTVAHGLLGTPAFMIFRQYEIQDNIYTWHQDYDFNGTGFQYQVLATAATATYGGSNLVTAVDDTNITFGTAVTRDQIIYAWSEIPGYSAFGSYQGNNNADGSFIWTGMKPAFVIIKGIDVGTGWVLFDTTRSPANPNNMLLYSDVTNAEISNSTVDIDFLSNGFKLRTNNSIFNGANKYAYCAWAENPFSYPVTAR